MSIQNEQWPHASCGHCGADDCPGDCYAGLLARIAELEAKLDPPPDGYPSWEDWLVKEHDIHIYPEHFSGRREWGVYRNGKMIVNTFFPAYLAALAAAKKEAGR